MLWRVQMRETPELPVFPLNLVCGSEEVVRWGLASAQSLCKMQEWTGVRMF